MAVTTSEGRKRVMEIVLGVLGMAACMGAMMVGMALVGRVRKRRRKTREEAK
jgi:hypothetical protein